MHAKRFGRGMGHNQYSHEYHLARAVQCADCGVSLHKDHFYVFYGNRCRPCWQAVASASMPAELGESAAVVPTLISEEEYSDGTYSQV